MKYKMIFQDSSVALADASNIEDAAILILSNRLRSKKDKKVMCAFTQDEKDKSWKPVVRNVTINLTNG